MAVVLGILSQKGGVGKSMITRLVATEYARAGWKTLVADMDVSQGTSKEWAERRKENNLNPQVDSKNFSTVEQALENTTEDYDLIIFDGAPHATRKTKKIAEISHLIILPTGNSIDDLNPQIRLAHEMVDHHIDEKKIAFLLSRVGTSQSETYEVSKYIKESGYYLLDGEIPEKTVFRQAIREGRSITETRYPQLNERCELVVQSIVNRINKLNN